MLQKYFKVEGREDVDKCKKISKQKIQWYYFQFPIQENEIYQGISAIFEKETTFGYVIIKVFRL